MSGNPAHTAYSTAKGYVQSAFVLMNSADRYQAPTDLTFFYSFHMLIGFAVELYLKAYLLHAGHSGEKLSRQPFGHDLEALSNAATSAGLTVSGLDQVVMLLADPHGDYTFRYPRPDSSYTVPDLNILFGHLSALDVAVDAVTGASASHGRALGGVWHLPPDRAQWRLAS